MTKSQSFGPFKVRPHIVKGRDTGKWCIDVPAKFSSDGKRKRTLFDNCKDARREARELHASINPVTGLLRVRNTASGITLDEAIEGWLEEQELRVLTLKKRRTTLEVEEYRLKALLAYFANEPMRNITAKRLGLYQSHRLKLGRKPVTINSELSALGFVFDWANREGHKLDKPRVEQIPVRTNPVIIPTPEEVVRIIRCLPERLRPVVRFLAETGCRKGEVLNLTWDCVDEFGGNVEIIARDGWTPKTQQSERIIPLGNGLLEMLRGLPKESEYVFPGKSPDKPLGDFKNAWATAVKKANIQRKGKRVHIPIKSLRKAHATWQAERGTNESVLQGLLGHAKGSRVTKRYYVQVTEQAKRAAVLSLPIANNGN